MTVIEKMTLINLSGFDALDSKIIEALSENARMSMRDLAEYISMSAPSATERVRKLTDSGAIRGFTVDLDPKAFGYSLQAIVRIKPRRGQLQTVAKILVEMPECIECDEVTGEDCFIARIWLRSIESLEDVLAPLKDRSETNTSIVHKTTVRRRHPPVI
jgi:Lrp/AsnC family leucine-responsive transcriptional regulator